MRRPINKIASAKISRPAESNSPGSCGTLGEREINPKRVANNLRFVLGIARYPTGPAGDRTAIASRIIRYQDCSR
jgi:hypothetical protein